MHGQAFAPGTPELTSMIHRKTLLVALDFGPHSDTLLSEAMGIADQTHGTIHLLHVFTREDKREAAPMSGNEYAFLKAAEQSRLQAARSRCRARGRLGTVLWHEGDPATQILLAASALSADMIVMGACSRGALAGLRLGSVAEAVLRKAPCTVMVVRHKQTCARSN